MSNKRQILAQLREEFESWEALLAGLDEGRITARPSPSDMSIKDEIAHLWAWQQRSIARLEAALHGHEPRFPNWHGLDPEQEEQLHDVNAWILATNRDKPWDQVRREWREGFLRFLELGEAVPEEDLFDAGRYPWMEGHPLSLILEASYEHHHIDHLEPLRSRLAKSAAG